MRSLGVRTLHHLAWGLRMVVRRIRRGVEVVRSRFALVAVGIAVLLCGSTEPPPAALAIAALDSASATAIQARTVGPEGIERVFDTLRIDSAGGQHVLVSDEQGLIAISSNGATRRLWATASEGDSGCDSRPRARILALTEVPSDRGYARLVMLVDRDDNGDVALVLLQCEYDSEAACEFVGSNLAEVGSTTVHAADFDDDGVVDLFTWGDNGIALYLGEDSGRLEWPSREAFVEFSSGLDGPGRRLVLNDLDDDGHIDVASVVHGTTPIVLYGDGAGGWEEQLVLEGKGDELEVVDLDTDGHLDVVLRQQVFLGGGGRAFVRVDFPEPLDGYSWAVGQFSTGQSILEYKLDGEEPGARLVRLSHDRVWSDDTFTVVFEDGRQRESPGFPRTIGAVVGDLDGTGRDAVATLVLQQQNPRDDGCRL